MEKKLMVKLKRSYVVMIFIVLVTIIFLFIFVRWKVCKTEINNIECVGLESMESITPEDKNIKWFHENHLVIKNGLVSLSKSPICIKNGQKWYSASDGGFYIYSGKLKKERKEYYIEIKLKQADYVARRIRFNPEKAKKYKNHKKWTMEKQFENGIYEYVEEKPLKMRVIISNGNLIIDNVVYKNKKIVYQGIIMDKGCNDEQRRCAFPISYLANQLLGV
jgi:hypothetical protein